MSYPYYSQHWSDPNADPTEKTSIHKMLADIARFARDQIREDITFSYVRDTDPVMLYTDDVDFYIAINSEGPDGKWI